MWQNYKIVRQWMYPWHQLCHIKCTNHESTKTVTRAATHADMRGCLAKTARWIKDHRGTADFCKVSSSGIIKAIHNKHTIIMFNRWCEAKHRNLPESWCYVGIKRLWKQLGILTYGWYVTATDSSSRWERLRQIFSCGCPCLCCPVELMQRAPHAQCGRQHRGCREKSFIFF